MQIFRIFSFFIVIVSIDFSYCFPSPRKNDTVTEVEIEIPKMGKIIGKVEKSYFSKRPIYQFLGINYAKPPSKERRFQPPEPFEWTGTYRATKMRQQCPQLPNSYYPSLDPGMLDVKEDVEDCLVVNVFTPEIKDKEISMPVMFYIHGGSFYAGSAYDFNPDFLLEEDVVLVVVQYRLGILGFVSVDEEEIAGNMGALDVLLALEWVNRYVRYFGGNSSKVTVVGQSAGAALATSLLVSPLVNPGWIDKMIVQSGSAICNWAVDHSPLIAAKGMAEILKCDSENVSVVIECFRNSKVEDLIKAHAVYELHSIGRCGTGLVVQKAGSKKYLTEDPNISFRSGKFHKIPMMGGVTREEGSAFVAAFHNALGLSNISNPRYYERNVTRDVLQFYGGGTKGIDILTDYFHNIYFGNKKTTCFADVASGLVDISGVWLLKSMTYDTLRLTSEYSPTFAYSFNFYGNVSKLKASDSSWGKVEILPAGVAHSDELGYLFPDSRFNYTKRELNMVKKMTKLWTNFIEHGKPYDDLKKWPPMTTYYGPYLRISDGFEIRKNFYDEYVVTSTEGFPSSSRSLARQTLAFVVVVVVLVGRLVSDAVGM